MKKVMTKISIFLLVTLISACGTENLTAHLVSDPVTKTYFSSIKPGLNGDTSVVSLECQNYANYAKSISALKEMGIGISDFDKYEVSSKPDNINSKQVIEQYVISHTGSPIQVYSDILLTCHKAGWSKTEAILKDKSNIKEPVLQLSTTIQPQ